MAAMTAAVAVHFQEKLPRADDLVGFWPGYGDQLVRQWRHMGFQRGVDRKGQRRLRRRFLAAAEQVL